MTLNVLGISTSPRQRSNSDLLLREALRGAESAGAAAEYVTLRGLCQCLWSRKYLLKEPLYPDGPRDRRALVIAVGGSRGRKVFDGIRLTTKYWFDSLQMVHVANLFVNQVDAAGDVLKHPLAMAEALRLGAALADADAPVPETPADVELFDGLGNAARPVDSRDGS